MTLPTTITITLTDRPNGRVSVSTDAARPVAGAPLSPAESLALDMLTLSKRQQIDVQHGAEHVPAIALAKDLLDPEMYGYAVTAEVHNRARRVLGIPLV